jgi:hypothetical protein
MFTWLHNIMHSSLYSMVQTVTKCFLFLVVISWVGYMGVTFFDLYSTRIHYLTNARKQDEWLIHKCNEPEFAVHVSHMSLCEGVFSRADRNIRFAALSWTYEQLTYCGSYGCVELFIYILERLSMSWLSLAFLAVFLFIVIRYTYRYITPWYQQHQRTQYLAQICVPQEIENEETNNAGLYHRPPHAITWAQQRHSSGSHIYGGSHNSDPVNLL